MEGEGSFPELLGQWEKDGLVRITQEGVEFLWNGSGITLEHLGTDAAKSKGQGTPVQIRVFDEATQLMESRFRFLRGWVSMTEPHKDTAAKELEPLFPNLTYEERRNYFPRIVYSTNPIGVSAGYFRRNFVKAAQRYEVFEAPIEDGGHKRVYIPFKIKDNPFEDEQSVRRRISGLGDEAMTDALLNENWDAPVGDFIREYDEAVHVVPDLLPPDHFVTFRAFDWGGDDPFSVLWFCISTGDEFVNPLDGQTCWFPRNSIIVYREWYGCDEANQARGINMPNVDIAKGIIERTIEPHTNLTLTDNLPFQKRGGVLMATEFLKEGVMLTQANTARVVGWKKVRDALKGQDGRPLLYICQNCHFLREYLPALQRHATKIDDAVESGEATHSCVIGSTEIKTPKGMMPIQKLLPGDFIISGDGAARPILNVGLTRKMAPLLEVKFSDGTTLKCTPDHEILTSIGWLPACDTLGHECILSSWTPRLSPKQFSNLMASDITSLRGKDISRRIVIPKTNRGFIGQFGRLVMGQFRKAFISTIKTTTDLITNWRTWNLYPLLCTSLYTPHRQKQLNEPNKISNWLSLRLPHGTEVRPGENGTGGTTSIMLNHYIEGLKKFASNAAKYFKGWLLLDANSVTQTAKLKIIGVKPLSPENVYCLSEPVTRAFTLSNGVVCANCDTLRYGLATHQISLPKAPAIVTAPVPLAFRKSMTVNEILKQRKVGNGKRNR